MDNIYIYVLLFIGSLIFGIFCGMWFVAGHNDNKEWREKNKVSRIAKEMREDFLLAGIEEKDHVLAVYYMMELIRDTKEQLNDFKQYIRKDLK